MAADTASYEYTSQGWLKKITWTNGDKLEYFYDDMGNRTSTVFTAAP